MLFKLERKLSFEDIRFYRSIVSNQIKQDKILAEAVSKSNPADATSSTWSSYFFGATPQKEANSKDPSVFTQEQVKQLFETIEYDPEASLTDEDVPFDSILFSVSLKLKTGSLDILSGPQKTRSSLMKIIFSEFSSNISIYPLSTIECNVSLKGMTCVDSTNKSTLFPNIIQEKRTDSALDFLNLEFKIKPLDKSADTS